MLSNGKRGRKAPPIPCICHYCQLPCAAIIYSNPVIVGLWKTRGNMLRWIYTLFVLAHGLAHMVYVALANGHQVSESSLDWTGGSWLLSKPLGEQLTRTFGSWVFTLVTISFIVTAGGLATRQAWATNWLIGTLFASSIALFIFWDGGLTALVDKGLLGLAISIALLLGIYLLKYPNF